MPFVDRDFINDLPNRVDIVGLINKRVALKKAGKDYKACCPFHEEKTPSFTVVPTKQIYHCFGCGESGGIIDFIMKNYTTIQENMNKNKLPTKKNFISQMDNILGSN